MAGPSPTSGRDDPPRQLPSTAPLALPRQFSMKRTRGPSVSSNSPHIAPVEPALRRADSNQAISSSPVIGPDRERRPSLSPSLHARELPPTISRSSTATSTTASTYRGRLSSLDTGNPSPAYNSRTNGTPIEGRVPSNFSGVTVDGSPSIRYQTPQVSVVTRTTMRNGVKVPALSPASTAPTTGLQSVGEFAQQHLFTQFKHQATAKIEEYIQTQSQDADSSIEKEFGPGHDQKFDQLLVAIGHSAARNPSSFIDKVTRWHDKVIENTDSAEQRYNGSPNSYYRTSEDRRTSLAIYLLCRALLEILHQATTTRNPLSPPELARVERLVYERRFRALCKEMSDRRTEGDAKWRILTDVIGALFEVDFEKMADRVQRDLNSFQPLLESKPPRNSHQEHEALAFIKGLRNVKLKSATDFEMDKSCNFLMAVTRLFERVRGTQAKIAYCKFIGGLLLPVAGLANKSLFQALAWRKMVQPLSQRLSKLEEKGKYWSSASPVQAILACASPNDFFVTKFKQALSTMPTKLREHKNRAHAIKSICRLLWTYLDRHSEASTEQDKARDSSDEVADTIKEVIRIVFFAVKRYSLSTQGPIAEPLVQLIRIIGHRNQDLCFRSIIFPLLNRELLQSVKDPKELKPDQLDPDRSVIGVRGCLAVLNDIETDTVPPFPKTFDDEWERPDGTDWVFTEGGQHERHKRRSATPFRTNENAVRDQFTRSVAADKLSPTTASNFRVFCDLVDRTVLICDGGFGGQASIDDRYALPSTVPKTPLTASFNRKDDVGALPDDRAAFFALLHVGICALPRCWNNCFDKVALITCLCNGTAHTDGDIAYACGHAIRSIAKQGHAQLVIDRFLGFILNYDNRCSIGGTLNLTPEHVVNTLGLYVQLLRIWVEEVQKAAAAAAAASASLTRTKSDPSAARFDRPALLAQVDRVESQALFFLCSPSPKVRCCANDILQLVTSLDSALGQSDVRIHTLFQTEPHLGEILHSGDELLTVYQKAILQRGPKSLVDLICGNVDKTQTLWYHIFPTLVDVVFRSCPVAVAQTRDDVCTRLAQMQTILEDTFDNSRGQHQASLDLTIVRPARVQPPPTLNDMFIDAWKAYLIFACKTLTRVGSQVQDGPIHTRKSSKSSQSTQESFNSGSDLFSRVLPFLSSHNDRLRHATIAGLGSIGITLIKPLLEAIEIHSYRHASGRTHLTTHSRTASSPRRHPSEDFSVELAQIYDLIAHFLHEPAVLRDDWIMKYFSDYTKDLSTYLHSEEGGRAASSQLKIYFCTIVEKLWVAVRGTDQVDRWMPLWKRRVAFTNMEDWTGLMGGNVADQQYYSSANQRNQDARLISHSSRFKEKDALSKAAMSAMATLCDGPLSAQPGSGPRNGGFNYERLMDWVHKMFLKDSDSINETGRRALKSILKVNPHEWVPAQTVIQRFYSAETPRCLASYLTVALQNNWIVSSVKLGVLELPHVLTALLFTLCNSDGHIRTMSARLLRQLDEQRDNYANTSCRLQDYDMGISDRTPAVYKKAQFEITTKLAVAFESCSDKLFAEFSRHFARLTNTEDQRSFVHAILPWVKKFELQWQDHTPGQPVNQSTPTTFMVLMNLLQITLNYSAPLQHEVQALWQTLVASHKGNVRLILEFTMDLTLERRNPKLVEVARQIIVFISDTPAGDGLVGALLQQITPAKMEHEERQRAPRTSAKADAASVYAHIGEIPLGDGDPHHPWDMTAGQLSLILLVDLIVAPRKVEPQNIPPILQAIVVLWDHKIPIVQEQAREMLVHLIHELILSNTSITTSLPSDVEIFVDRVRQRDKQVLWSYTENERSDKDFELSQPFQYVVSGLIKAFEHIDVRVAKDWGLVALQWAMSCRVLHLALRALQVYRCILMPMDEKTVSDLIRVLSTRIADDEPEAQAFSLEAMRTIRALLQKLDEIKSAMWPQLFWGVVSCLRIGRETQFEEALVMLDIVLNKLDLADAETCAALYDAKPASIEWPKGGLTELLLPGCRSSRQFGPTLLALDRLIQLPSNQLIGAEERYLYVLLANLPRFVRLHTYEGEQDHDATAAAGTLSKVAARMGYQALSKGLEDLSLRRSSITFASDMFKAIYAAFFPAHEFDSLVFMMGLLTNSSDGMQQATLMILDSLTDQIDMKNPAISQAGPDLVSPLLRLIQTDLTQLALAVLDKFSAIMSNIKGKQQLNMSMAHPTANRDQRKPYDEVQSLFGIPEETGWSVAVPGKQKTVTRDDLLSVANMYVDVLADPTASLPTPEIDFYKEDYANGSYFTPHPVIHPSGNSDLAETSMGELVSRLDSLDDFFDEDDDENGTSDNIIEGLGLSRSPADTTPTGYNRTPFDSFDSVSTASNHSQNNTPTLQHTRSFASSSSSTKTTITKREPVMSPSAFNLHFTHPSASVRPPMLGRSVTSPIGVERTTPDQNSSFNVTPEESEPFSDDDVVLGGGATSDASSMYDASSIYGSDLVGGNGRKMPRTRSIRDGMRSGMRSGLRRVREGVHARGLRGRVNASESPEVPKVPEMYLFQPTQGGTRERAGTGIGES